MQYGVSGLKQLICTQMIRNFPKHWGIHQSTWHTSNQIGWYFDVVLSHIIRWIKKLKPKVNLIDVAHSCLLPLLSFHMGFSPHAMNKTWVYLRKRKTLLGYQLRVLGSFVIALNNPSIIEPSTNLQAYQSIG